MTVIQDRNADRRFRQKYMKEAMETRMFWRHVLPVTPTATGGSAGSNDGMHYIITDKVAPNVGIGWRTERLDDKENKRRYRKSRKQQAKEEAKRKEAKLLENIMEMYPPRCEKCKGVGWIGNKRCSCRPKVPTPTELRKEERSKMNNALRMKVFQRDKFTCQICGFGSPYSGKKYKPGIELEVDHKWPVARDGKTTMKNLQTLCKPCNSGKHTRIIDKEDA
jgi:5-methylcytosine-specific restriction endonuclease McrA